MNPVIPIKVEIVHVGAWRADELMEGQWILLDGEVGQVVQVDFHGASRAELKVRVGNNRGRISNRKRLVDRTTEFQCLEIFPPEFRIVHVGAVRAEQLIAGGWILLDGVVGQIVQVDFHDARRGELKVRVDNNRGRISNRKRLVERTTEFESLSVEQALLNSVIPTEVESAIPTEVEIVHVGAVRAEQLMEGEWIVLDGEVGQVVQVDFHGASRAELKVRVVDDRGRIRNRKRLVEMTTEFQRLAIWPPEFRIVHVGVVRAEQLMAGEWFLLDGMVGKVVQRDFYGARRVELKVRVDNNRGRIRNQKRLLERNTEFQCLAVELA